ncbi:M48 family metalloprotease [Candidatus Saccharibacteria bacterium]|nr:M48 family metalloprotease [Candidatus Saccharibacteria bacterium]NCS82910.1 M48 family metalloprotease [Candidatus Saccharibacteria bacterium]
MYKAIAANKRNTVLIMAVFVALITGIGYVVSAFYGEPTITYWVLSGAAIYAFIQYFLASKLAVAMTGSKEIQKKDNPRLYRIVENLSITLGIPMPKVYVMDDPAPNAFATGRNPKHAIVAATTGLMDIMDDRELEAVMAHEMGHVQNYDIRVSMIAFGLVSAIALLSDIVLRMFIFGDRRESNVNPIMIVVGLIVVVLAPIIAAIVQMAVSRQREYLADVTGVMTTRDSDGMASALEKLRQYGQPMKHQNTATSHLFISNPLKKGSFSKLFSTHPPLEDRIKRLREHGYTF